MQAEQTLEPAQPLAQGEPDADANFDLDAFEHFDEDRDNFFDFFDLHNLYERHIWHPGLGEPLQGLDGADVVINVDEDGCID
eukprot:1046228-Heterocapsa_arctica.AAC.1